MDENMSLLVINHLLLSNALCTGEKLRKLFQGLGTRWKTVTCELFRLDPKDAISLHKTVADIYLALQVSEAREELLASAFLLATCAELSESSIIPIHAIYGQDMLQ
jgi:hypothetical protein